MTKRANSVKEPKPNNIVFYYNLTKKRIKRIRA